MRRGYPAHGVDRVLEPGRPAVAGRPIDRVGQRAKCRGGAASGRDVPRPDGILERLDGLDEVGEPDRAAIGPEHVVAEQSEIRGREDRQIGIRPAQHL